MGVTIPDRRPRSDPASVRFDGKVLDERLPLVVQRTGRRGLSRAAAPVSGIPNVPFTTVEVGVQPAAVGPGHVLRDVVGALPITGAVEPEHTLGSGQPAGRCYRAQRSPECGRVHAGTTRTSPIQVEGRPPEDRWRSDSRRLADLGETEDRSGPRDRTAIPLAHVRSDDAAMDRLPAAGRHQVLIVGRSTGTAPAARPPSRWRAGASRPLPIRRPADRSRRPARRG